MRIVPRGGVKGAGVEIAGVPAEAMDAFLERAKPAKTAIGRQESAEKMAEGRGGILCSKSPHSSPATDESRSSGWNSLGGLIGSG